MKDSTLSGPRHRAASAGLTLATMSALVLLATPASAQNDPDSAENFSPDADPATAMMIPSEEMALTDRFDGANSTFHVATVTTTDATLVQYYICPVEFPSSEVDAAADPPEANPTLLASGCGSPVGQDTEGVVPPGSPAGAGEVYEADIDVPSDETRDFVAWVCTGTVPTNADECDAEVEAAVPMDDVSTGTPANAASSGEITVPAHGSTVSNTGFSVEARTSPDVTAVTFCMALEDQTTNEGADEGDGTALDGDPTQCEDPDPDVTTVKTDATPNNPSAQQSSFKTWSVVYDDAETLNDKEMAVVLFETGSTTTGANPCRVTDCQLDSHYIVSAAPAPQSAEIVFPDEGTASTLPNFCTEAEGTSQSNARTQQYTRVEGCVFDQSGSLVTNNVHWAFEITPVDATNTATDETGFECSNPGAGSTCSDTNFPAAAQNSGEHRFGMIGWPDYECSGRNPGPDTPPGSGCPSVGPQSTNAAVAAEGIQRDFDGDRFYEQADGDPGQAGAPDSTSAAGPGFADEVLEFHTGGTYQVTFCYDSTNNAATSPTPCADETIKATATHTASGVADHVHAKRLQDTDGLCHAGGATIDANAGSVVTLRGCTVALVNNVEQPAANVHVLWLLNPEGTTGNTGTLSASQNTTNSQGQATANVSSTPGDVGKTTTVRFCLDEFPEAATGPGPNGNNVCDAAEGGSGADIDTLADLRINWGRGQGGFCDPLRPTAKDAEIIVGTGGADRICGFGGPDTLRGVGGNDTLLGGTGDDVHSGGAGKDSVRGGGGDDVMRGGGGNDKLKGSGGRKDTARGGPGEDLCKAETEKGCEKG